MSAKHFSHHQDLALALCIERFGACPFGCGKDGAPNCHANVTGWQGWQCELGRLTQAQADEHYRQQRAKRQSGRGAA